MNDLPDVTDDDDLPAVDNPPKWGVVASLAEAVGADAKTPHVVVFVNDDGDREMVITETLRGSDVDGSVGFYDAEAADDEYVSLTVEDVVRVRPLVDPRTGDAVDDVDVNAIYDHYLTLDELLGLIDGDEAVERQADA